MSSRRALGDRLVGGFLCAFAVQPAAAADGRALHLDPGQRPQWLAFGPREMTRKSLERFVESNGYLSIEASHYTRKVDGAGTHSPSLEYRMYPFDAGCERRRARVA
jgi:hypothetical protein